MKSLLLFSLFLCGTKIGWCETHIKKIDWQTDGDVDLSKLSDLLALHEGEVFSYFKLERGTNRLAETGSFKSIYSHFNETDGTLQIVATLAERLAGTEISFNVAAGELVPDTLKTNILEVLGLSTGDPIRLDMLADIKEKIKARLAQRGYFSTAIATLVEDTDSKKLKRLVISVDLGKRSTIKAFHFTGFEKKDFIQISKFLRNEDDIEDTLVLPSPYEFEVLPKIMKVELPYDTIAITEAFNKWASSSRSQGYYDFQIKISIVENTDDTELNINLNRGLKYNVQFSNNVVFWERELRAKALDRSLRLAVPFAINEAESIVTNLYQELGFTDVKVKANVVEDKENKNITFNVVEGKRYYLGNTTLSGPTAEEMRLLRGVIDSWTEKLASPWHKVYFNEKALRAAVPEYINMVRRLGYLKVRLLDVRFQKKDSAFVDLNITLQLGERYPIRSTTVIGNLILKEDELSEIITLDAGKYADPDLVKSIGANLENKYKELGFLNAKVNLEESSLFQYSIESPEVDIEYVVDAGPLILIGNTFVNGLKKTKERVVTRELKQNSLLLGKPWTPSAVTNAEEHLLGLGIFNSAKISAVGGSLIEKEEGKAVQIQEKDLQVNVSERAAGALEFGPGFRTNLGLIGFAELNYRNLGGWNRNIIVKSQVSKKFSDFQFLEQDYSVTYIEPYFLNLPFKLRLNASYDKKDATVFLQGQKVNGFNKEEVSYGVGIEKEISRNARLYINVYTLSLPRIFDIISIDAAGTQTYRIGSVGATFSYDKRDNIFVPQRGFYSSTSLEYSAPSLGSDSNANFSVLRQTLIHYTPLYSGVVWAASLNYARLWGMGDTEGVPQNKRLTLGGLNSIRSLNENSLGFSNDGVKNEQSVEFKTELRQPLFDNFGLAWFFDMGEVEAFNFGRTGFRKAAGFGFRYGTPVGPLALDFAFNLNRKAREDKLKIQFSIGTF